MNTEPKRLLKMLDVSIADKVQPTLAVGQPIEYTSDGVTRNDLLVDKTAFSVTIKQPTCKLTVPIEFTTAYQLEKAKADMARPKKTAQERVSQPPAMHPSEMQQTPAQPIPGHDAAGNLMLPPGSQGMPTVEFHMPPMAQMPTMEAEAAKPVREVTIHQVRLDPEWTDKAIDDMVGTLADSLRNLVEGAIADTLASKPVAEKVNTCFQCIHIDIEGNQCALFKMLPPLVVLSAPEGKCKDFVDGSAEIPM